MRSDLISSLCNRTNFSNWCNNINFEKKVFSSAQYGIPAAFGIFALKSMKESVLNIYNIYSKTPPEMFYKSACISSIGLLILGITVAVQTVKNEHADKAKQIADLKKELGISQEKTQKLENENADLLNKLEAFKQENASLRVALNIARPYA